MSAPIKTYGGPPVSLVKACQKHVDKISEVGNEGEDGYWVYMRPGWWNEADAVSCIHEHTVASCVAKLRNIKPDPRP